MRCRGECAVSRAFVARLEEALVTHSPFPRHKTHVRRVMDVCGGSKFARTIATPGFVKSSLSWFFRDVRRLLFAPRNSVVVEGGPWADASVVTLDGEARRLFDYRPSAAGRPLVLNFGSWT